MCNAPVLAVVLNTFILSLTAAKDRSLSFHRSLFIGPEGYSKRLYGYKFWSNDKQSSAWHISEPLISFWCRFGFGCSSRIFWSVSLAHFSVPLVILWNLHGGVISVACYGTWEFCIWFILAVFVCGCMESCDECWC